MSTERGELFRIARRIGVAVLGAGVMGIFPVLARPAAAQEDFRASDPGRPTRVEDATPLKFREWETELGLGAAAREEGSSLRGVFELKAGLLRNTQVGVELEGGLQGDGTGETDTGLEAVHAHVLHQLGRETRTLPAIAFRGEVGTPGAGPIGRDDWSAAAEAIATRSFNRLRLHGNAGYGVLSDADGGDYASFGLGFDYPIGLFSRAILGAVSAEIPVNGGRSRVWFEVGSRLQVSNWTVLDVGLTTRLDQWEAGNANVELVFGVSRVFGIAGLVGVPAYPEPSIR